MILRPIIASNLLACSIRCPADKWAYRWTISGVFHPPVSLSAKRETPDWTSQLALVCLKSWNRKLLMPARFSAPFHALLLLCAFSWRLRFSSRYYGKLELYAQTPIVYGALVISLICLRLFHWVERQLHYLLLFRPGSSMPCAFPDRPVTIQGL